MQLASIKAQEMQAAAAKLLLKQQVVPFTPDNVTNQLIRFIAANDQVRSTWLKMEFIILYIYIANCSLQSINVVENRQFRDLLTLFRDDYNDDDMPHRSRIRQGIIEAWQGWFLGLKGLLKVS
jgi:hypothetical protein